MSMRMAGTWSWCVAIALIAFTAGCRDAQKRRDTQKPEGATSQPAAIGSPQVPQSLAMGGAKSVMTFFVTSTGSGKGGDLGGLDGADAHCAALANAEGAGDHTWRAYLSTSTADGRPGVNARDRIGKGPWYNAEGLLIAANLDELHSRANRISKDTAVTEKLDPVNLHDMLTGSRPDGTAYGEGGDLTCRNWTSSAEGRAQLGHHDRRGPGGVEDSWNSVHASNGCRPNDLRATGGAGLFYCFGID